MFSYEFARIDIGVTRRGSGQPTFQSEILCSSWISSRKGGVAYGVVGNFVFYSTDNSNHFENLRFSKKTYTKRPPPAKGLVAFVN